MFVDLQLAQLNNPGMQQCSATTVEYACIRCRCQTRVRHMFWTKANPKAVWSRHLRSMQVSLCWWSVNCCVQACKQTQRDTQGTKRAKCAHVGDTNNTLNGSRPAGPCIRAAALAAHQLRCVDGFETPSWEVLADGLRQDPGDTEPGGVRHGWQHEAASRVERDHRDRVFMPTLADHQKALLRSQRAICWRRAVRSSHQRLDED